LEAGINFLLIKPVDTEELLDTLSHFRHRPLAPGPTLPRTPPI
jgi:hypothetical protein